MEEYFQYQENESYNVVFRSSAIGSSFVSGTRTDCTFYIPFQSFISPKYQLFKVKTFFQTGTASNWTIPNDINVYIYDIPNNHSFDTDPDYNQARSSLFINAYRITLTEGVDIASPYKSFYKSRDSDMADITTFYPRSNMIRVVLTTLNDVVIDPLNMISDWEMIISFTPI